MSREVLKRGKISRAEDEAIQVFLAKYPDQPDIKELARLLRRIPSQIENYCMEIYGKGSESSAVAEEKANFVREFRARSEWKFMKTQFSQEELDYYEELYVKFMRQFKDDIEATEEFQIFSLIEKLIFINRFKKQAMDIQTQILSIDREIMELQMKDPTGADPDLVKKIQVLQNRLQTYANSEKQRTETYTLMEKQKDAILTQLKGTREQRIKNIQSSKQTYIDLIKAILDKKLRAKEGRRAALYKAATDQAELQLMQPHKYMNDEWDQPLLVPENVLVQPSGPVEIAPGVFEDPVVLEKK